MFKVLLLISTLAISGSAFASGTPANDVSIETTNIEIPETEVQSEKLSKGEDRGRCKAKSGDGSSSCRKRCEEGTWAYCRASKTTASCWCQKE